MRENEAAPRCVVWVVGLSENLSSGKVPAKRNGVGHGGPARGYSWPQFEKGNRARVRHSMFAKQFTMLDLEEIDRTADSLREILPVRGDAFEPLVQLLSARLWRLRRAYEFVAAHSEDELPRNFGERLNSLELLINRTLSALGMSPASAAELGVNLARLAGVGESGPAFDWGALEPGERTTLERLLSKGRGSGGD